MRKNLLRVGLILGVLLAATLGLGGCYVSEGPVRVAAAPAQADVATSYYTPMYYQGYVVYYNAAGLPYYYLNGRTIYIPSSYAYYNRYLYHWRRYRPYYYRWYRARGYRYRAWRRRGWRRGYYRHGYRRAGYGVRGYRGRGRYRQGRAYRRGMGPGRGLRRLPNSRGLRRRGANNRRGVGRRGVRRGGRARGVRRGGRRGAGRRGGGRRGHR